MPVLPTTNDQIDSVLTRARTRASGYADEGNLEMAYKALLRGVQSAQRKNNAGQMGAVVSRVWATPAVRGLVLTAVPGILAARTRSKSKSTSGSTGTQLGDSSTPRRARLHLRGRKDGRVEVVDETALSSRVEVADEKGTPPSI
jgi:hypothetical protein